MTDPLSPLLSLPGVAESVGTARDAVDGLLGNRVLRRRSSDVSAESALRGAWASAWLEGTTLALADVRAGSTDDPVLQGALRVQSSLGALADVWRRAPRQVLARLHVLAAADLVEDPALLGRPARSAEVAARLDGLVAVLTATSVPAVVLAGVVHGEVRALDAFPPVSGLVARAAVRLVLVDRGLDPKSLVVVEAGHRELGAAYPAALRAYAGGSQDGVAQWLRHCADAVVGGAREASAICTALARG